MKTTSILFFASYAAALAVRSNQPTLDPDHPGFVLKSGDEKRAICNADNLLRNFRDKRYSSSASEFCSLYIQSTITNVFEATATEHQTATQYSDAPTVTDVTFVVVTVTTGTETVTRQASAVNKRDGSVAYPTWLAASYPASRVSSACSCFIPAPSPAIQTSTTAVLSTETKFITETLPPTDTTTVTVTSVSTENAVATQVVDPPCGLPGCVNGSGHINTRTGVTVQQCKAACLADSRCQSYQHNPGHSGGYCNMFSSPVNAVRVPSSADVCSEWRVYERAATCVA